MLPNRSTLAQRGLASVLFVALGVFTAAAVSAQVSSNVNLLANADDDSGYNDIWGYTAPNGDEYAILGTQSGTAFYNVTVPTAPVRVGFIDGPDSVWRDMKTYGDKCYIVTEGDSPSNQTGLQVVDLSDPENPNLINTIQNFNTAHNIFIDVPAGRAYVVGASPGGSIVYDVAANGTNPPVLGTFGDDYIHDIYVRDNLAYSAEIFSGQGAIYDVTDPDNWVQLTEWSYPGAATHNTWINDDATVLVTTDETGGGHLNFWDVSNPNVSPPFLDDYVAEPSASAHNAFYRGDFVYVSYYTEGLRVLTAADPNNVSEVGFYDTYNGGGTFAGAWGCYPYATQEGIIYVSDISTGLYVLEFDPDFGIVSGTVTETPSGDPIEGATVEFVEAGDTNLTNSSGDYTTALSPGSYTVNVSKFGFEDLSEAATVVAGQTTSLDFQMTALPTGGLSGTVTDGSSPLAGVLVQLEGTPLSDITDASGNYDLGVVPIGSYDLSAQLFRFSPGDASATLSAGQQLTVDFTLLPAFFFTEMETDPGWQVDGDANTGTWVRVDPNGTDAQPENDHTPAPGTLCWVTGQGSPGGGLGENDVDDGFTRLTSSTFDLTGLDDPAFQYHRWYSNDQGGSPGEDSWLVQMSNNGFTWLQVENTTTSDASWQLIEVRVRDLFPEPASLASIQIRFTAQDFGGGSIVEAGVDDLQIVDLGANQTAIPDVAPAPAPAFRVAGNFPNPFNPSTRIQFETPSDARVQVRIYDLQGRMINDLLDETVEAGVHDVTWDGRNANGARVASGVYFYRVDAGALSETRRMVLAK